MDVSLFFAKLFGFYFVFSGLFLMVRKHEIEKMVKEFFGNPALIAFAGCMDFLLGLLVILFHNQWEASFVGFITFLGYVILTRGLVRTFFPTEGKKGAMAMVKGPRPVIFGAIIAIIGLYLLYIGF